MKSLSKFFGQECNAWLRGAMLPSEIWWLYKNIIASGAEVLIECGRQDGYSTKLLAELLTPHDIMIYSIDFDEDKKRLEGIKKMLAAYKVECVSGDIHQRVPEILKKVAGKKVAVVQDGPKGWEGMATLLAAAINYEPVLLAQHNLHVGHKSRKAFQMIAPNPAFLEFDAASAEIHDFRAKEIEILSNKTPNRDILQTSLGCMLLNPTVLPLVREIIRDLEPQMKPWSAVATAKHWAKGDYKYISRMRAGQKYSLYRFKKR
ncbi:MAG: hypothetical protein EON60_01910 [Alphaproteobacteria bacterium]|nr:MAG: hypothetical protein EON60_01910 [Alphaproteobacteria bacterium]